MYSLLYILSLLAREPTLDVRICQIMMSKVDPRTERIENVLWSVISGSIPGLWSFTTVTNVMRNMQYVVFGVWRV